MSSKNFPQLNLEAILAKLDTEEYHLFKWIKDATNAGAEFFFGVDKITSGYFISINCSLLGDFYLCPKMEVNLPAIVPDDALAGSSIARDKYAIVFFISTAQYHQFMQEAEMIFKLYYNQEEDGCFRVVPDIWHSEMHLIQFITEHIVPHPSLSKLYQQSEGIGGRWYSRKNTR